MTWLADALTFLILYIFVEGWPCWLVTVVLVLGGLALVGHALTEKVCRQP